MTEKILLVEDDSITRQYISEGLRSEGYEVAEAGDGHHAVELLDNRRFDLVITDFFIPRLDGIRLAERIHRESPQTPIIVLTAYISQNSAKGLLRGVAEFLRKPVELEVLLETTRRLLRPPG